MLLEDQAACEAPVWGVIDMLGYLLCGLQGALGCGSGSFNPSLVGSCWWSLGLRGCRDEGPIWEDRPGP